MTKSSKHYHRSQKENSSSNSNNNNEPSAEGIKEFKKNKLHPPKKDGKSAKGSLRISTERQDDIVVYKRAEELEKNPSTRTEEFEKNPSATYNDETHPQEYTFYVRKFRGIEHVTQEEISKDFKDRIDRIDEVLVASLRVQKIFRDVKNSRQARCLHIPISWILDDGPQAALNTEKERKAYQQKKGVTKGLRPPTSMVSAVVRKIAEDSKLFDLRTKDTGRIPNSHAGAFFVMKTNNKLRVIIDGRVLNSFFNGSLAKFSLFTLESLKQVIDNLSAKHRRRSRDQVMRQGRWYAINLDLRHWFHQIPLPWRYQRYMFINMTDRDNRNKDAPFFAVPRAAPMGWILAPIIAQCCTYALLLADGGEDRRVHADADLPIEFLKKLEKEDGPPTWIPLNRGGGIFVLLDNILIVTPVKEVAEFWLRRLANASQDYHAVFKLGNGKEICTTNKSDKLYKKLKKECYYEMRPPLERRRNEKERFFTFLGVDWRYEHHRVSIKDTESETLPGLKEGTTNVFEHRRDVASILGKLMWHRRVHRYRYYDKSTASNAILSVYRKITPGENDGWNDPITLADEDVRGLTDGWNERLKQSWCKARPLYAGDGPLRIMRAAVDAATKAQHAAYVIYTPGEKDPHEWERFECPDSMEDDIAIQELYAILLLIRKAVAPTDPEKKPDLIVLGTDSMVAKNWCEQGHGHNDACLDILREIDKLLEENTCRLYMTYINTTINVADLPSRENCKSLDQLKSAQTEYILKIAEQNAKGMWWQSGDNTGADKERVGGEYNMKRE